MRNSGWKGVVYGRGGFILKYILGEKRVKNGRQEAEGRKYKKRKDKLRLRTGGVSTSKGGEGNSDAIGIPATAFAAATAAASASEFVTHLTRVLSMLLVALPKEESQASTSSTYLTQKCSTFFFF